MHPAAAISLPTDYIRLVDHATTPAAMAATVEQAIQVYPNPATTALNLTGVPEGATITIHDATGYLRATHQPTDKETAIDIHRLRPGLHVLRITYGNEIFIHNFVKE